VKNLEAEAHSSRQTVRRMKDDESNVRLIHRLRMTCTME